MKAAPRYPTPLVPVPADWVNWFVVGSGVTGKNRRLCAMVNNVFVFVESMFCVFCELCQMQIYVILI